MKKFLVVLLAIIGALTILVVFAAAGIALLSTMGRGSVPGVTILEIDLEEAIVEYVPEEPFSKLFQAKLMTTRDVVDALERASQDDRVVALVARVGTGAMGLGQIQEIRDAVRDFRESGKTAVAYAETFGEVGPGNGAYYLSTAFDEIYLQPAGDVGLTGLMYETPFIRGTLEKLGVEPRMDHRHEYKNAKNIYTERSYTPAHREATEALMRSQFDQIVRGIAEARHGLEESDVRALADRGPYLGQEAVEAGLVDGLRYRDEVYDEIMEASGERAQLLYLRTYLKRAGRPHTRGDTIALIYGVGPVVRGPSEYDALFGESTMGSDSVSAAFRDAIRARDVKAIVFRVDSPGGSYVASDTVWRETIRAKAEGKPVIVTMGNVAGSGGYFVSMSADKIVAQPGTITASIGVVGGKFLTSGFWEKLGLSWDEVHSSANATMWTGTQDYSPAEWGRFQSWLDRVYEDFTGRVAEGRELPIEQVLEIAKGRVWTGEDAKEIGLVDELGGFDAAFRLAREAAGLDPEARIRVRLYPRPRSAIEVLLDEGAENSQRSVEAAALARVVGTVRPLARLARQVGLLGGRGVLSMPETPPAP